MPEFNPELERARRLHEGLIALAVRLFALRWPSRYFRLTRATCAAVGHRFVRSYDGRGTMVDGEAVVLVRHNCCRCHTYGPWIDKAQQDRWLERHGVACGSGFSYRLRPALLRLAYGARMALRLQPDQNDQTSVFRIPPL